MTYVVVVHDADVTRRVRRVWRVDNEAVALLARQAARVQDLEVLVHAERRFTHVLYRQTLAVKTRRLVLHFRIN